MAAGEPPHRQIKNEVKDYVLWEQWLGQQLLLDYPADYHPVLLLRRQWQ